jgi:hypothetical protein
MCALFASREMHYAFGRNLPGLIESNAACVLAVQYDCPVVPGKSQLA